MNIMDQNNDESMKSRISKSFQRYKPTSIRTFDDSDIASMTSSKECCKEVPNACNGGLVPRTVPSHLLMISILEQLCFMYAQDEEKGKELFKAISSHLARLNVVPALTTIDEMHSVRSQYRLFMDHVLHTAMLKIDKTRRALPSPTSPMEQIKRLSPQTSMVPTEDLLQIQTSRYKTEFTEEEKIGKGGFGAVYKAKHKLDGRLYAIKKIKFKHSQPDVWMKVLREVKALANLQHPNIVGYNAAWLEYSTDFRPDIPGTKVVSSDESISSRESRINHSKSTDLGDSIIFDSHVKFDNDYSMDNNPSSLPKLVELTDSWEPVEIMSQSDYCEACEMLRGKESKYTNSGSGDKVIHKTVPKHSCTSKFFESEFNEKTSHFGQAWDDVSHIDTFWDRPGRIRRSISCDCLTCRNKSHDHSHDKQVLLGYHHYSEDNIHSRIHVTLFIQMELCSVTLREYMQKRNTQCSSFLEFKTNAAANMRIFKQLVKGVDFIHSNGLIHRDLKPRNIFLQGHLLHVKIGDFGLAKDDLRNSGREDALLTPSPLECPDKFYWDTHTTGVGTSTYGAPEQLQGSVYTNKSDIYSLGVILYELFHWFKTDMEKYKSLELLRQGEIDAQILQHWPEQAKAVIQMTNSVHSDRPTTKELLQSELFLTKDQIILEMQTKIDDQALEIQKLKDMLKERDVQMEILTSSLTLEQSRLPHKHKTKKDKT
ncbi:EIF2AK1 [Mytilus edulis]|uniref:Eukaryotic translation initiation factor 2-alpha kinase 1 n=1 Tax=Mytilus edulis TaxID=6550 RepID=A0A8S3U0I7_MYTED|nr:EIF2AK1 [Mytilus edulis]